MELKLKNVRKYYKPNIQVKEYNVEIFLYTKMQIFIYFGIRYLLAESKSSKQSFNITPIHEFQVAL